MSDESKELTLRVHDECSSSTYNSYILSKPVLGNGSDVFGSDICTCKPYLTYAIEECIRGAQNGGVGVVVYFRKEGRALGEVTKYVVVPSSFSVSLTHCSFPDILFTTSENVAAILPTSTSNRLR